MRLTRTLNEIGNLNMPNSTISSATLASLSDIDLVARARTGDGAAFELIVRRHNQALFRAALGVVGDESLAQEVIQEAYLKAFTRLDSFEERASLKTWLTRIVVNQAIDFQRHIHAKAPLQSKVSDIFGDSYDGSGMASQIIDHYSPEAEVGRQDMKILLEDATKRLAEIYRSVFVLRDIEGLSVAESAYCLGISEDLVKKRLSRAREMLRKDILQKVQAETSDIFEFAGKRCDVVTANVMAELMAKGMIKEN